MVETTRDKRVVPAAVVAMFSPLGDSTQFIDRMFRGIKARSKYSPKSNRNLGILPGEAERTRQSFFSSGFTHAFSRITAENKLGDYSSRASRKDRRAVAREIVRAAWKNRRAQ
jgi:hypothetical protein